MRYVKWTIIAVLGLLVTGFLHYTLPRHDIVRIVGVENRRSEYSDSSTGSRPSEPVDMRFINAMTHDDETKVYRNEATGWRWPPYFKIGTSGLQTKAQDLVSTREAPKWVVVRYYGWYSASLKMFPNAVSLRQVDGPDVLLIPWLNIVIVTLLAAALLWVRMLWRRLWRRSVGRADAAGDRARGLWKRIKLPRR